MSVFHECPTCHRATIRSEMDDYTPSDSLKYLDQAHPLDWVAERLLEKFADIDDVFADEEISDMYDAVRHTSKLLKTEAHYQGVYEYFGYSNGHECTIFTTDEHGREFGRTRHPSGLDENPHLTPTSRKDS